MRFSLIIPVYNVAPYLRACLDSVVGQTFADFECICVDDGSADGSGAILDAYAARDVRFKVIHQPNGGEGAARNAGLDIAKGEWICFLDADDVFNRRTLEVFAEAIREDSAADLAAVEAVRFDDGEDPVWGSDGELSFKTVEVAEHLTERICRFGIWQCAYRANSVHDLRFGPEKICADRVFYAKALERVKRVSVSNYSGYGYRLRRNSAFHARHTAEKFLQDMELQLEVAERMFAAGERYPICIRRFVSLSCSEYRAVDYSMLSSADRRVVWRPWMKAMRTIVDRKWARGVEVVVLTIVGRTESHLLMWMLCYGLHWLKKHGLNRRLSFH